MQSEAGFLVQLAERPFDRALRLVFADFLQDLGDPRGEAIALGERGGLSLRERRRLSRLTEENAAAWLGPLAGVADVPRCRFEAGFLDELCLAQAPDPLALEALVDEPRLSTVRSLVVPISVRHPVLSRFIGARALRSLLRLSGGLGLLSQLEHAAPAFSLAALRVESWGLLGQELALLPQLELARKVPRLELCTMELVNPPVALELRRQVLAEPAALRLFREVRLVARYGTLEGAAAWLVLGPVAAAALRATWPPVMSWSVEHADVTFELARDDDGSLSRLAIDLRAEQGALGLGRRASAAAGVLVQLAAAQLVSVEVQLPQTGGLRPSERDALRAATRRLGTVQRLTIGGQLVP